MNHILKHSQTTYIAVTVAELLILTGLWSAYSHFILLLWFLAVQVAGASQFIVCKKFAHKVITEAQLRFLTLFLICNAVTNGVIWGSLAWFLGNTWNVQAVYVLLPIAGVFAGAINKSPILSVYFALVMPIMVQVLAVLLFTDAANLLMAGFFVGFFASMIRFSVELHKMLMHDFSLQLKLEAANGELVIQREAAEQANLDKSRFLAAASHDLRQPLYAMELFLGNLAENHGSNKRGFLVSRLRSALDGLKEMFTALLDMSRFDAGVIIPTRENFSGDRLLQSLRLKFEPECNTKGIDLRIRPCSGWIYSDPVLVRRVLENFVANAIKYTDAGGVLVACRKRGDCLRLEVWDTGKGIREKDIGHVFDAFLQLDNPERNRRKGVGLGLAIVDQVAKLLNTPVLVRSTFDRGSVFAIDLPMGEQTEEAEPETDKNLPVNTDMFVDLKVWIVDDDRDILEGLELQLEVWGSITRTFASPEQVRDAMQKTDEVPVLLITDLRLRDSSSGIALIRMLQNHWQKAVPSIIITGDTGPEQLQETHQAGFPVLHKPVSAEKLRCCIMEILS